MSNAASELDVDYSGYDEAVARENAIRGAACLGLNEMICGLEVRPMCAAHVRLLSAVSSPFLWKIKPEEMLQMFLGHPKGEERLQCDILRFLWIVSLQYQTGSIAGDGTTPRDKFNEAVQWVLKLPVDQVVKELLNYVDEAYTDAEESARGSTTSYYAFETSIAHELAKEYPTVFRIDFWNPDCPRAANPIYAPLKIVFQLRKLRTVIEQGTKAVTNKSDKELEKALQRIMLRMKGEDLKLAKN